MIHNDSIEENIKEAREYIKLYETSETRYGKIIYQLATNVVEYGETILSNKSQHQLRVEQFMNRVTKERSLAGLPLDSGQEVGLVPRMIGLEGRRLRAKLILEEALELIKGLGFELESKAILINAYEPNLVEIVDGCLDLSVVTIGTLSAFGVPDESGLRIVDENNLKKFEPGFRIREDGKLVKPPGHVAPNLAAWLESLS